MGSAFDDSTLDAVEEGELPPSVGVDDLTPVEAVTRNLRGLFRGFTKFDDTYLVGEVGDLSPHSEHLYFSINAAATNGTIRCVVWASRRDDVDVEPEMLVAVRGTLSFYEDGGHPSLEVTEAHPVGESAYRKRLERLRESLRSEGLLDPDRKRALPRFPEVVGVVTAAGSDAEQDLLESIHGRYPDVDVRIHSSAVQGANAVPELEAAVEAADDSPADVVVVARGGGSDTALRPFNEERVVRAVAAAETPTAAGEAVVVDKAEFRDRLEQTADVVAETYRGQVARWRRQREAAIERAYRTLAGQWVQRRSADVAAAASDRSAAWIRTRRRDVDGRAARVTERWLAHRRRAVRSSYRELATDWLDDHRTAVERAVSRIEQEQTFEAETAGLRRRNRLLIAVVVLLLLLLVAVGALALGVV